MPQTRSPERAARNSHSQPASPSTLTLKEECLGFENLVVVTVPDRIKERIKALYSDSEWFFIRQTFLTVGQAINQRDLVRKINEIYQREGATFDCWGSRLESIALLFETLKMDGVCIESRHDLIPYLPGGVDPNDLERFFDHFNETDYVMVYLYFRNKLVTDESDGIGLELFQGALRGFFGREPHHQFKLVHQLRSGQTWENRAKYLEFLRQIKERYDLATSISESTLAEVEAGENEIWARHIDVPIGTEWEFRPTSLPVENMKEILSLIADLEPKTESGAHEISPPPCWNPHTLISLYHQLRDGGVIDQYPTTAHDNVGKIKSGTLFALSILFKQMTGYSFAPHPTIVNSDILTLEYLYELMPSGYRDFSGHRFESKEARDFHPDHFAKHTILNARLGSAQLAYEKVLEKYFGVGRIDMASNSAHSQKWDGRLIMNTQKPKGIYQQQAPELDFIWKIPLLDPEQIDGLHVSEEVKELAKVYVEFLRQMHLILADHELEQLMENIVSMPVVGVIKLHSIISEIYDGVEAHYEEGRLEAAGPGHLVARSQRLADKLVAEVEAVRDGLRDKFFEQLEILKEVLDREPDFQNPEYPHWQVEVHAETSYLASNFPEINILDGEDHLEKAILTAKNVVGLYLMGSNSTTNYG